MYKVGTIKLTWIDPSDYRTLSSNMYSSVDEALKNTSGKKNWLIFRLKSVNEDNYTWELLPYGVSDKYVRGMQINDKPILKYTGYVLMGVGAYMLIRYTVNRLKKV